MVSRFGPPLCSERPIRQNLELCNFCESEGRTRFAPSESRCIRTSPLGSLSDAMADCPTARAPVQIGIVAGEESANPACVTRAYYASLRACKWFWVPKIEFELSTTRALHRRKIQSLRELEHNEFDREIPKNGRLQVALRLSASGSREWDLIQGAVGCAFPLPLSQEWRLEQRPLMKGALKGSP